MQEHLGEVFEGVVSSVVKFGVFVLLRQFDVDGLLRSINWAMIFLSLMRMH